MLRNAGDFEAQQYRKQFEKPTFAPVPDHLAASPDFAKVDAYQPAPAKRGREIITFDVVCIRPIVDNNRNDPPRPPQFQERIYVVIDGAIDGGGRAADDYERLRFLKGDPLARVVSIQTLRTSERNL